LPKIAQKAKDVEKLCKVFENVKSTHVHMVTNRSNENAIYRNALLFAIVSSKHRASQKNLSKIIDVNKYSFRKAIVRQVHVVQIGENIGGGGLLRKQWCDVLDEKYYNYIIKNWWDITTTISLNRKDVKRKIISAKTFEQHAPHYLQES